MVATLTTYQYNHTARRLAIGGGTDIANLKVMLLNGDAVFNAANTTLAEVAGVANANEVSGNGWTAGGELFANVAVTTTATDDATLAGDDVRARAAGGNIGPASGLVIYDDTDPDDAPLFFVAFSEPLYAGEGVDFLVPGKLLTWTYTAPA